MSRNRTLADTSGYLKLGSRFLHLSLCLGLLIGVATGPRFLLAGSPSGTVVGWGDNYSGQTRAPAGLSNVVAVSSGLALKSDGTAGGLGTPAPAGLSGSK